MNRKNNFLRDLHKFLKSITEDLTTNSAKTFIFSGKVFSLITHARIEKNRKKVTVERKKKKI